MHLFMWYTSSLPTLQSSNISFGWVFSRCSFIISIIVCSSSNSLYSCANSNKFFNKFLGLSLNSDIDSFQSLSAYTIRFRNYFKNCLIFSIIWVVVSSLNHLNYASTVVASSSTVWSLRTIHLKTYDIF